MSLERVPAAASAPALVAAGDRVSFASAGECTAGAAPHGAAAVMTCLADVDGLAAPAAAGLPAYYLYLTIASGVGLFVVLLALCVSWFQRRCAPGEDTRELIVTPRSSLSLQQQQQEQAGQQGFGGQGVSTPTCGICLPDTVHAHAAGSESPGKRRASALVSSNI